MTVCMTSRRCPVCDTSATNARLFLERNVDSRKISVYSYASRNIPEYMCHRMVQCPVCDLVYADDPPAEEDLAEAYHVAEYDSNEEANDAALVYGMAIAPVLRQLQHRETALEIGTGTGIFLEHLQAAGFDKLVGVEPSYAAIAAAPPHRRNWIKEGMFIESDFEPQTFDLICCFMTLEHVRDPGGFAQSAFRLLRPGGVFLAVTHDYRSPINRLLGKKSAIIDIEHLQLFSRRSISGLLSRGGFEKISVASFSNRYSLRYWLRLTPLPPFLASRIYNLFGLLGLRNMKVSINVGNILTWGFKGNE